MVKRSVRSVKKKVELVVRKVSIAVIVSSRVSIVRTNRWRKVCCIDLALEQQLTKQLVEMICERFIEIFGI